MKNAPADSPCAGVSRPFVVDFDFINPQNTIERALKTLVEQGRLQRGMTVVIVGAISVGTEIVDAVQMRTV